MNDGICVLWAQLKRKNSIKDKCFMCVNFSILILFFIKFLIGLINACKLMTDFMQSCVNLSSRNLKSEFNLF